MGENPPDLAHLGDVRQALAGDGGGAFEEKRLVGLGGGGDKG